MMRGPKSLRRSTQEPVQQEQERRRGEHDKRPTAEVVTQEITVDEVEREQTSQRDRNTKSFLPPRDNQSDHNTDGKENQRDPFARRNPRRMKCFRLKQQDQKRNAGQAAHSRQKLDQSQHKIRLVFVTVHKSRPPGFPPPL